MADFEELEPLFDYKRCQPSDPITLDDDELDQAPEDLSPKRRKVSKSEVDDKVDAKGKRIYIRDDDSDYNEEEEETEKENEDWLPSPPKVSCNSKILEENPIIRALRLKKQELVSIAQSAEDALKAIEESAKEEIGKTLQFSVDTGKSSKPETKPETERPKIVLSIQDKDGLKQFRVYLDDKFERLFKLYAEKVKLELQSLVFCFDGDKIGPQSSPEALGMEDNDIIEVHVKSS